MSKTAYIVACEAFEYNDEYYSEVPGIERPRSVYMSEEAAERAARMINIDHAAEVLGDLRSWVYGGVREMYDAIRSPEDRHMFKLNFLKGKEPGEEEEEEEDLSFENVTPEDLGWLVDCCSVVRCAHVREVELVEEEESD